MALRIGAVPFDEAIKAARARGVVLPDTYRDRLKGAAKARGFTISGMMSLAQIGRVLDSLIQAIMNGESFGEWKKRAAEDIESLSNSRKELVFRNAVQTSYGAGRWQQLEQAKALRPILMYDAINDRRTRPAHRAMDNFMAPVGDPIWRAWAPPNGHNCRCTLLSLTLAQARARGYRDNMPRPDVMPDPGWDYNPAKGFDDVLGDLAKERVQSLPPPLRERARKIVTANKD